MGGALRAARAISLGVLSLGAIALGVLEVGAPAAHAQDGDAEPLCRALFRQADAAADGGRAAEAAELYARSLAQCPRAPTALNLAVVLAGSGRYVEAVRLLDAVLAGEYGSLTEALTEALESTRERASARIGERRLVLEVPEGSTLRVDGDLVPIPARGSLELRLDPGTHALVVRAPDGRVEEREIDVESRSTETLRFAIDPRPPSGEGDDVWASPWLHVGLGVALLAGGVALTVGLLQEGAAPIDDPTWGHAEALRF